MSGDIANDIAKTWVRNLPVLKLKNDITKLGVELNRFDVEIVAPYLVPIAEAWPSTTPPRAVFEQVFSSYKKQLSALRVEYDLDLGKQAEILKALKHCS